MGKIVFKNFNEGDGYYNVNLAYLSKEQFEEIEALVSKWSPTDEDIKDCIRMCLTDANEQRFKDYGTNLKDCLAWLEKQADKDKLIKELGKYKVKYTQEVLSQQLEKQSEQKTTNKVEPKFHEGDWIVNNNSGGICQVTEIKDDEYCLWPLDAEIMGYLRIIDVDNEYHLWSIQDAKDGDVLAYVTDEEDLWIMIYWSLYEHYEGHVHYHALLVNDNFSDKGTCCIYISDLKPATKEQCDTLFTKMREAGYEWDVEKKELRRKVEPKFKIDDWITNGRYNKLIVGINSDWSFYIFKDGTSERIKDVDKKYHLWTIQDAKDVEYLYVFDYTTGSIYQIDVSDDEREAEEIIGSKGLRSDDCLFMYSGKELTIEKL